MTEQQAFQRAKTTVPPTLEQVRITAAKAKLACLQMKQAGEMLQETLLKLEAQASTFTAIKGESLRG